MTSKTILLTRPEEEAQETAFFLKKNEFDVLFLPLFAPVQRKPLKPFSLDHIQAVIATSQRSVQAFAQITSCRSLPLYAVGDRTAFVAQQLGFQNVASADGTVEDLTFLVERACIPEKGGILYISGALINHDLPHLLTQKGFQVQHDILYEMKPLIFELPPSLIFSFKKKQIWGTLLFSPQTAFSFSGLMRQARLGENCEIGYLFCLSQAVAYSLSSLGGNIKIAKKPNQASLLEIVNETIYTL